MQYSKARPVKPTTGNGKTVTDCVSEFVQLFVSVNVYVISKNPSPEDGSK